MRNFRITQHPALQAITSLQFSDDTVFTGLVSNFQIPVHTCDFGLVYCINGVIKIMLNGSRHELTDDRFLIINRNSILELTVGKALAQPIVLYFQSRSMMLLNPGENWTLVERFYPATEVFKKRIKNIADLPSSCSSFITMQSDALIRSLLSEIKIVNDAAIEDASRLGVKKRSTRESVYRKIVVVRDHIENHYEQSITLAEMAAMAAMNQQHFLRLFAKIFHKTPRQYLIDIRIEAAKRLLKKSDMNVEEVCQSIGWDSLGTFSKLFKERTGMTPGHFRNITP